MLGCVWSLSYCPYLDAVDVLLCILEVTHDVVQLVFSVGELLTLLHQLLNTDSMTVRDSLKRIYCPIMLSCMQCLLKGNQNV